MMRYFFAFILTLLCIAFIFLFPFPGLEIPQAAVIPAEPAVLSFHVVSYTVLPQAETVEMSEVGHDSRQPSLLSAEPVGKKEIAETEKESVIPEEEASPGEKSEPVLSESVTDVSSRQPGGESRGESDPAPSVLNYTPDFSLNRKPVYPVAAKRRRQQGSVRLVITADSRGVALKIDIEESSGYHLLDRAAVAAVRKWDFSTVARGAGRTIIRTTISFKLTERG